MSKQDIEPTMTIKVGGIDIDVFFVPGDNDSFGDFTYLQTQIRGSEEHTSELQSRLHLVCRLLLEKKKTIIIIIK